MNRKSAAILVLTFWVLALYIGILFQGSTIHNQQKQITQLEANQVKLYNIECQELNLLHQHYGSKCQELK